MGDLHSLQLHLDSPTDLSAARSAILMAADTAGAPTADLDEGGSNGNSSDEDDGNGDLSTSGDEDSDENMGQAEREIQNQLNAAMSLYFRYVCHVSHFTWMSGLPDEQLCVSFCINICSHDLNDFIHADGNQ